MADRGIIFSTPMVRALLDGRKTQTRRLAKPRGSRRPSLLDGEWADSYVLDPGNAEWLARDLPCAPGDRLYVREAWTARMTHGWTISDARSRMFQEEILYRADGVDSIDGWWPSIHMPREFSRLWLNVTDVRVQRVQDISREDAIAEGLEWVAPGMWAVDRTLPIIGDCPRLVFSELWNSLHTELGERWDDNPWIVAVTFEVNRGNIDTTPAASDAATPRASAPHALSPEAGQRTPLSDDDMAAAIQ